MPSASDMSSAIDLTVSTPRVGDLYPSGFEKSACSPVLPASLRSPESCNPRQICRAGLFKTWLCALTIVLTQASLVLTAPAQAQTAVQPAMQPSLQPITPVLSPDAMVPQTALWFDGSVPKPQVEQALEVMRRADLDGLRVQDYRPDLLQAEILALTQTPSGQVDPARVAELDAMLTAAMERFLSDLVLGRVSPKDVHQDFDDAPAHEFDASAYLRQALAQGDLTNAVAQAAPKFPLYPLLKQWLARYRQIQGDPAWEGDLALPAGGKLEAGQTYPDAQRMRGRLKLLGDYVVMPGVQEPQDAVYDADLKRAVRSFQERHGLTVDGVVGKQTIEALNVKPADRIRQIELSMERVRWTPLQHADRLLVVNIPGFMLYGYETDGLGNIDVQLEMRVVIGRALNHRTPLFDESMRYIEFSPYWNIPPSIARSETIPAIKRDPGYFSRQQLEFVDGAGNVFQEVTPQRLDAVRAGQLRIRQRPGPRNALGDVKFVFPNNMNIFMHHTPATQLFSRSRRDFSHGCIRVEAPVDLARFVLANDPAWDENRIRQAMGLGRSNTTRLQQPVPVVIAYSTVMARDNGKIYFYSDIYGHDERLGLALEQRL
ncbi:L,D-transpeptidase family protein [Orrella marina]|nr:L,D-transpeptidase family protein [Orrella marina]